jgi:type II secretory pathway pseudopilin PulG
MVCESREREQGFLLLGLVVAIFLILLALSVAAPKMSRELQREREIETVHRGNQYVRAIQLYYRKFGHYPGSMEQLAKTNEIRFLRQNYVDPMTGKVDWRLIKVGENKTTVKGFFGKPLAGLAAGGLGSAAGMASSTSGTGQPAGASGTTFGGASSMGPRMGGAGMGGSSSPGFTLGTSGSSQPGASGAQPGGSSGSMFGSSGGAASTSVSNLGASSGPFVGVGLVKDGDSIVEPNEQTTYKTWEFIYDPRIEQLKAKGAMMGGGSTGPGSSSGTGSSGFGTSTFGGSSNGSSFGGSNSSTGFGNSTSPASNAPAANPNPQ